MPHTFAQMGLSVPDILLPQTVDAAWPCPACDQYTARPEIWQALDREIGDRPSALRLILPEAFLSETETRLPAIEKNMALYRRDILTRCIHGFMLTERRTQSGTRLGLIVAVDLEYYDHAKGSDSPIRATEGTILSRLPPRVRVRRNAPLECTHILLLMDDRDNALLPTLRKSAQEPLYDVDLPLDGGHLTGYAITDAALDKARDLLSDLWDKRGENPFLAVGDGNHSLATAKAVLEEKKAAGASLDAPARYALVELTNLYDEALVFHPIHRLLLGLRDDAALLDALGDLHAVETAVPLKPSEALLLHKGRLFRFALPSLALLQQKLDALVSGGAMDAIDYIHGDDEVLSLGAKEGCAAILLPAMDKLTLFDAIRFGPLPRKAFSMGEANEKRMYVECRALAE